VIGTTQSNIYSGTTNSSSTYDLGNAITKLLMPVIWELSSSSIEVKSTSSSCLGLLPSRGSRCEGSETGCIFKDWFKDWEKRKPISYDVSYDVEDVVV